MSVTLVNTQFLATLDSRVVDKGVQFTLFPEDACFVNLDEKDNI